MRFFIVVLSLALAVQSFTVAQPAAYPDLGRTAWHRIPLSAEASIELPGAATVRPEQDTAIKAFSAHNQYIIYTVVAKKLTWLSQLTAELNPELVYQGVLRGTIGSLAHGRVVRRTFFELAGRRGLEAQLELPSQPNLAPSRYLRILYANGWVYSYSWRQLSIPAVGPLADDSISRNKFFATFQLRRGAPTSASLVAAGWRAGQRLFSIVGLLGLLVLVGLLARYRHHTA